jgi:hypothetical protein
MSAMGINLVNMSVNPVYHNITGHEPKLPTRDEPFICIKSLSRLRSQIRQS